MCDFNEYNISGLMKASNRSHWLQGPFSPMSNRSGCLKRRKPPRPEIGRQIMGWGQGPILYSWNAVAPRRDVGPPLNLCFCRCLTMTSSSRRFFWTSRSSVKGLKRPFQRRLLVRERPLPLGGLLPDTAVRAEIFTIGVTSVRYFIHFRVMLTLSLWTVGDKIC